MKKTKKIRIGNQLKIGISTVITFLSAIALGLTYWALNFHNENAINGYSMKKVQTQRYETLFAIELLEMEIADLGKLK